MANTVPNNSNNNGDERKKHGKNNKVNKGKNYEALHIAVCQKKRTNSNQSLGRWCGERELSERCGQSTQNDLVNNSAQEQKYQK